MRPGDFDTKLGEAEFVIVEVPFANYANDDDTETLYMAYVGKPPTVAEGPFMRPEPKQFSPLEVELTRQYFVNVFLTWAGLLEAGLMPVSMLSGSPLNLHLDHRIVYRSVLGCGCITSLLVPVLFLYS